MQTVEKILTGRVLSFANSPFEGEPQDAISQNEAVAIAGGKIVSVGAERALRATYPNAQIIDYADKVIVAGFVDAHVHYPQTAMIASWGKRLIDWLNSYTFPEESKFSNPDYCAEIAGRYFDLTASNGTTTMCSFCTVHPESVDAFFAEAQKRNQRVVAGKTCMYRSETTPDFLRDSAQASYDQSKSLLQKWHQNGRGVYAITPRFSPTSTPEQLEALGALWGEYPDALMQTHLSEQTDEIEWVKGIYPDARDYLDTYEKFGLLGQGGLYGHAIYLEDREKDRLREVDAGLVHCPTSNTFIGSGLFDMGGLMAAGHRIGLATDTGGGSSFSMLRTMAAAYEIGQLRHNPLHPAQLLWLATQGSARSLHMEDKIGNIAPGMEADIVVLDLASTPAIAQRVAQANDLWEAIFPTIMMGDDRAIADVFIAGEQRKFT